MYLSAVCSWVLLKGAYSEGLGETVGIRRLSCKLICRDVEANPGPNSAYYSISILHLNIRSIRQKLEFIQENL